MASRLRIDIDNFVDQEIKKMFGENSSESKNFRRQLNVFARQHMKQMDSLITRHLQQAFVQVYKDGISNYYTHGAKSFTGHIQFTNSNKNASNYGRSNGKLVMNKTHGTHFTKKELDEDYTRANRRTISHQINRLINGTEFSPVKLKKDATPDNLKWIYGMDVIIDSTNIYIRPFDSYWMEHRKKERTLAPNFDPQSYTLKLVMEEGIIGLPEIWTRPGSKYDQSTMIKPPYYGRKWGSGKYMIGEYRNNYFNKVKTGLANYLFGTHSIMAKSYISRHKDDMTSYLMNFQK